MIAPRTLISARFVLQFDFPLSLPFFTPATHFSMEADPQWFECAHAISDATNYA